jgi:hypothetical protein
MRHNAMEKAKVTIAVILDPEIGDGLRKFAKDGPVWITTSPTNEKAVRDYWKVSSSNRYDVTFWSEPRNGATKEEWLSILDDLELHHSEDWSGPGIAGIQVVGAPISAAARAALSEFGYTVVRFGSDSFSAEKQGAA